MGIKENLYLNLIKDDRYMYLIKGLGNTLLITIVAVVVGILLGFFLAYIRTTHDKTGRWKVGNLVAHLYITVIRGTPMVLQLLIVYFVIFASVNIPTVEVHLSDINSREEFRRFSYVSRAALKTYAGLGFEGYRQAIRFLKAHAADK